MIGRCNHEPLIRREEEVVFIEYFFSYKSKGVVIYERERSQRFN